MQVFVESPELGLAARAVTLTLAPPSLTLLDLKLSLALPLPPSALYFTLAGRPIPDSSPLSTLTPFSTLALRPRLPGGGGDGGSTCAESRDCYLNMYSTKKPDKVDPNETRLSRWTTCALSAEPLAPPCVADRLGNLFNKQPLVEALLHKTLPKQFAHIRGLKDMIPVHLASIPGASDSDEVKFHCPVSNLELNGKYAFLAIRTCGHVVSAKALKEVKSPGCLVCHKEFTDSDKITINGTPEEVAAMRERMEEERGRVREKKEKKAVGAKLIGTKHANGDEEKGAELENGKKDGGVKRFKATDIAPAYATKEVYASIFISSRKKDFKETYSCRSLPLGRN